MLTFGMTQYVSAVTLVVPDYDEALAFYVGKLGFDLIEDTAQSPDKRWVVVAPPGSRECRVLLAQAASDEQASAIGFQAGGRVAFFLHTDNFDRDFASMTAAGIEFLEAPRSEPYGKVVVFQDPFGNKWDFIQTR
jgi:catechol 2,3-dioxygenase-like lactoylglutathione lyase family enzyme